MVDTYYEVLKKDYGRFRELVESNVSIWRRANPPIENWITNAYAYPALYGRWFTNPAERMGMIGMLKEGFDAHVLRTFDPQGEYHQFFSGYIPNSEPSKMDAREFGQILDQAFRDISEGRDDIPE